METKKPHFSLSSIKPSLQSLESAVQSLMTSAGGTQAVLKDALGLLEKAMSSENVPLALVEEVISLVSDAIKQQAKS